jgi:DNA replication initiation complex subunit (GINS family)
LARDNQYNQIFQVWKNERQTRKLLPVSSSIYSKIRQKINELNKDLKNHKPDSISYQTISDRLERLDRILRDLMKIRLHKIIHGLLDDNLVDEGLAIEEKELVKGLQQLFEEHERRSIHGETIFDLGTGSSCQTTSGKSIRGKEGGELITIRILKDVPEIMDITAKGEVKNTYGPFKKEDIVQLPMIYAKTLIMKNAADELDLPL